MTDAPERIWAAQGAATGATMWWPDNAAGVGTEYIRADAAEAEKRAAVAAAYEKAADVAGKDFFDNALTSQAAEHAAQIEEAIRALSNTDALAEYLTSKEN